MQPKYWAWMAAGSHLLIQLSVLACLKKNSGVSTYNRFDMAWWRAMVCQRHRFRNSAGKMMTNAKMTEAVFGEHALYINHHLKNYDTPDHMDSANNPVHQKKALEIGRLWYAQNRQRIKYWIPELPIEYPIIA
ncbi:hypothetical protein [Nitrosomonas sp.]|uniref:hypothetical protein n=1 Tax=Nitrosomonas sp. TaxID=42353 RepID=UPI002083CB84|nr:hypothetical protein [Nitrosomonas sp.]GJL76096.1 MAG: hypothetical protein NMNS02_22020 [Nitrosomonas sp.]